MIYTKEQRHLYRYWRRFKGVNIGGNDYIKGISLSNQWGLKLVMAHLTDRVNNADVLHIANIGILLFSKFNSMESLSYIEFNDPRILQMVKYQHVNTHLNRRCGS